MAQYDEAPGVSTELSSVRFGARKKQDLFSGLTAAALPTAYTTPSPSHMNRRRVMRSKALLRKRAPGLTSDKIGKTKGYQAWVFDCRKRLKKVSRCLIRLSVAPNHKFRSTLFNNRLRPLSDHFRQEPHRHQCPALLRPSHPSLMHRPPSRSSCWPVPEPYTYSKKRHSQGRRP